jgi:hypothetical protein
MIGLSAAAVAGGAISLHARTRVAGFLRAGEVYLRAGDRLIVCGRVCGDRTSFADHMRPAL